MAIHNAISSFGAELSSSQDVLKMTVPQNLQGVFEARRSQWELKYVQLVSTKGQEERVCPVVYYVVNDFVVNHPIHKSRSDRTYYVLPYPVAEKCTGLSSVISARKFVVKFPKLIRHTLPALPTYLPTYRCLRDYAT